MVKRVVVIALAAALALVGAVPALGQDEPASPVEFSATVGALNYIDPDLPTSVIVELDSPELFVGTMKIKAGARTVTTAVEVPAESRKRYVVGIPALGTSRQVAITLLEGDQTVATETIRVSAPSNEIMVGLIDVDDAEGAVRAATTTPVGQDVNPLILSTDHLLGGITVLDYLVVGRGSLDGFSDSELDTVATWIRSGGRLFAPLVEAERFVATATADVLPGAGVLVARLGDGEVGVVEDAVSMTSTEWSIVLRDVPPSSIGRSFGRTDDGTLMLGAATAGRQASIPALPWLLVGIILFVLLVGPANFLVLRGFGKPELAWVTVPLLSAGFVALFWFVGKGQIQDFAVSQASVIVDEGSGAAGAGAFVLQTEAAGTHVLGFPAGWTGYGIETFGTATSPATVSTETGTTEVSFEMDALGLGVAQAGWTAGEIPITAGAAPADGKIEFTITNDSALEFWAWGIILDGRGIAGKDPLPAAGTGSISVITTRSLPDRYEPLIQRAVLSGGYDLYSDATRGYEVVNPLAEVAETRLRSFASGSWFFGFTSDNEVPVGVDEHYSAAVGPTLVVSRIELDDAALVALGIVRPQLLAIEGASTIERNYEEIWAYGADVIYLRYLVPDGVPDRVRLSSNFSNFEDYAVFDWRTDEFVDFDEEQEFDLTGRVSPSGEVMIRAAVPADNDPFGDFYDEAIRMSRFALRWSVAS